MSIKTNKSIFYHIPKTGGTWANLAIRHSTKKNKDFTYLRPKIDYNVKNNTAYMNLLIAHAFGMSGAHETKWGIDSEDKDGLFSYSFVREPLAWYKSYWASAQYMRDHNSKLWNRSVLHHLLKDDFEGFVNNVVKIFPMGALTAIYKCFLGENGDDLDFVGKQENLVEDFITAMKMAGENFDEKKVRDIGIQNSGEKWKKDVSFDISRTTRNKLMKSEKWVTKTFYNG